MCTPQITKRLSASSGGTTLALLGAAFRCLAGSRNRNPAGGALSRASPSRAAELHAKMLLATSYAATVRDREAIATYHEALKVAPNRLGIQLVIGQVYENELHWTNAIEEHKAELALAPANAMALAHLGHALTSARKADQAIPVLEKMLKTNPTDGEAYADLGKDWEVEGQMAKAIEAYERALAYDQYQYGLHYRRFELYRKLGDVPDSDQPDHWGQRPRRSRSV